MGGEDGYVHGPVPPEACLHPAIVVVPRASEGRCLECSAVVDLDETTRRWDAVRV